jgi:hypothetical protein
VNREVQPEDAVRVVTTATGPLAISLPLPERWAPAHEKTRVVRFEASSATTIQPIATQGVAARGGTARFWAKRKR